MQGVSNLVENAGSLLLTLVIIMFCHILAVPVTAEEYGSESRFSVQAENSSESEYSFFVEINRTQRPDDAFDAWYGIYFDNYDLADVESIEMTGPSNSPVYHYTRGGGNQNDFVENQWNGFHVEVFGAQPEVGEYTFTVVTKNFSTTVTHNRPLYTDLPIVDASTMLPADNSVIISSMPVFEWAPVENPQMPVYYRLQLFDDTGYRIFATQRISNLHSLTLPDGLLEPDRTYTWGVYIYDHYDHTLVENISSSQIFTFTTAKVLSIDQAAPPAIHASFAPVFSRWLNWDLIICWLDIVDHDGIAHNGSSHQVSVTYNGQTNPMYHVRSDTAYAANYEYWALSDPAAASGEYVFRVTDPEGNTAEVTGTIAMTNPLPAPDHTRFVIIPDGTTPTLTWDPVPGAARYRVRIVDMNGIVLWHGRPETHPVPSYTVPPGVLQPDTDYQFRIRAWESHSPLLIDNESISEFVTFTTDDVSLEPFIEIDSYSDADFHGAATWSSSAGTSMIFRTKIYDALGVPDNIKSVTLTEYPDTAAFPDGTPIPLYLESIKSPFCGIYANEDISLPVDSGDYIITVENHSGHTHSVTDNVQAEPIGYPADESIHATVTGTQVDFSWEPVPEAPFYRIELYDMDQNLTWNFETTKTFYTVPEGFLKADTPYQYRITTQREFDDQGVDNGSGSGFFNLKTSGQTVFTLSNTKSDITVPTGSNVLVYGTAIPNHVLLPSGAKAELINFPGENEIEIASDAVLFVVSRSGTVVTFQGSDGTTLKMPVTSYEQTIVFDDKGPLVLWIHDNQVKLNDQVIGLENNQVTGELQ